MKGRRQGIVSRLPGWASGPAVKWAWAWLFFTGFFAVFGPLIANEKPYYCMLEGKRYFPLFSNVTEAGLSVAHPAHSPVGWKTTSFESVWHAIIPYSYHTIDLQAGSLVSPFDRQVKTGRFRHWLGTDPVGRDILAGMIRGCRVSLLIGLGSMLLALLAGVPLGAAAAWWGNKGWRFSFAQGFFACAAGILILLLWYMPLAPWIKWVGTCAAIAAVTGIVQKRKGPTPFAIPLDRIVMNCISLIDGFPAIFLILIIIALIPAKGWVVVMCTIALLRWPAMARYMRAEVFKIRETHYIKAAQILNLPSLHILRKHIIPYAFRPVMVSFVFGVSSAILAESSLSYLGIGLPAEEINWGRLLAQSRNHFDAWWLVLFPGSAIFLTLMALYTIGNSWNRIRKSEK